MSMIEALRGVYRVEIPHVVAFRANTIGELYDNVIDLNKLDHDVVLRWWRMLHDYVTGNEDCRVFVRKLEHEQRRGFVSCFEGGLSYVFCDNSFAKVIYGLARQPYSPSDVGDFTKAVSSLKFKCLHCSHGDEMHAVDGGGNRYCVYKNGTMPNFREEWKLAHIIGVNQFYLGNYADFQSRYFQPGELEDWAYDARYRFVVRNMGNMRNPDDRGFFISHFLRFCNPMNYFLIPKGRKVRVGVGAGFARDISEDVNLLEYIRQRRLEEFGGAWREFEECARFSGFGDIANKAGIGNIRVDFSCQPVVGAVVGDGIGEYPHARIRRRFDIVVNQQGIQNGEGLSMRETAFRTIQYYVEITPGVTFEVLREAFPRRVNRYHETVVLADEQHDLQRYLSRLNDRGIRLNDGREVHVCGEWIGNGPRSNWPMFIDAAAEVGIDIVENGGA